MTTLNLNDKKYILNNVSILDTKGLQVNLEIAAQLHLGLNYVAHRCDDAHTLDGVGFSRNDAEFGKSLAASDFNLWTIKQSLYAYKVANKYRKQIAEIGLDIENLDLPIVDRPVVKTAHVVVETPLVKIETPARHQPFEMFKRGNSFLLKLEGYEIFIYCSRGEWLGMATHKDMESTYRGSVDKCKAFVLEAVEIKRQRALNLRDPKINGISI